jgi:hypothetical protein
MSEKKEKKVFVSRNILKYLDFPSSESASGDREEICRYCGIATTRFWYMQGRWISEVPTFDEQLTPDEHGVSLVPVCYDCDKDSDGKTVYVLGYAFHVSHTWLANK